MSFQHDEDPPKPVFQDDHKAIFEQYSYTEGENYIQNDLEYEEMGTSDVFRFENISGDVFPVYGDYDIGNFLIKFEEIREKGEKISYHVISNNVTKKDQKNIEEPLKKLFNSLIAKDDKANFCVVPILIGRDIGHWVVVIINKRNKIINIFDPRVRPIEVEDTEEYQELLKLLQSSEETESESIWGKIREIESLKKNKKSLPKVKMEEISDETDLVSRCVKSIGYQEVIINKYDYQMPTPSLTECGPLICEFIILYFNYTNEVNYLIFGDDIDYIILDYFRSNRNSEIYREEFLPSRFDLPSVIPSDPKKDKSFSVENMQQKLEKPRKYNIKPSLISHIFGNLKILAKNGQEDKFLTVEDDGQQKLEKGQKDHIINSLIPYMFDILKISIRNGQKELMQNPKIWKKKNFPEKESLMPVISDHTNRPTSKIDGESNGIMPQKEETPASGSVRSKEGELPSVPTSPALSEENIPPITRSKFEGEAFSEVSDSSKKSNIISRFCGKLLELILSFIEFWVNIGRKFSEKLNHSIKYNNDQSQGEYFNIKKEEHSYSQPIVTPKDKEK